MIKIDCENSSYVCPFCGHAQAYVNSCDVTDNGIYKRTTPIAKEYQESSFSIFSLTCRNKSCGRIAVTAINRTSHKQIDIVPQITMKHYPEYIPEQIRNDYEEANMILEHSPKAAATLLRRCLQGMIRDFWGIQKGTLNAEINELNGKISAMQWKAIDGLRKIGNIGAHMEKDVNLIIDIEINEAEKLLKLIELLFEKWYVARHDEEQLLEDIVDIADDKSAKRNV